MAVGAESLKGPRLEFVVHKLRGTVTREKVLPPLTKKTKDENNVDQREDQNTRVTVIEPAGYMVFMPTGVCYRLSEKEYRKGNFNREPNILNREAAKDNKSAVGRFLLAITPEGRKKAYADMEEEVIKACLRRVGSIDATITNYDPKGVVNNARAA